MKRTFFIVLMVGTILMPSLAYCQEETVESLMQVAQKCSGLSPSIVKSIIQVESRWNPYALNVNGVKGFQPETLAQALYILYHFNRANSDIGLMQINYRVWGPVTGLTPMEFFDPATNVCLGSLILRHYIDTYGGWRGVGRYNAVSPGKQKDYILRVAAAYKRLKD